MKNLFLLFLAINFHLVCFGISVPNAEPVRTPFIVLTVNGRTYQPNEEIQVRPGEKITVKATLMGGKRDYCMFPEKYANVGKNVVIESKGESGMSFSINGGQFRGVWTLTKETAQYKSDGAVKISLLDAVMNMQTEAVIEVPVSGFSKIFLKVTGQTDWHYIRNTPAGKTEQDETSKGESTFYLKIAGESGDWYNSANIVAKGEENFSIRNRLDEVQRFYNEIEARLKSKDFSGAQLMIENLKQALANVKSMIDEEKQKNQNFNCTVSFIGLPTDLTMYHIQKIQGLSDKWKEMYLISQGNIAKINDMLLNSQMGFSANVLRSVFKNYLSWGTTIPSVAPDILTIYDPKNIFTPVDLPRKVMGWYNDAQEDASILNQQAQTVKMLSELRRFYLSRIQNYTSERKQFTVILDQLKPAVALQNSLKSHFQSLGWANWRAK